MKQAIILILCFSLNLTAAFSVQATKDTSRYDHVVPNSTQAPTLTVHSNIDSATVLIDSLVVGRTPLADLPVSPGIHVLRCLHPNAPSWLAPMITETLTVSATDHIERTMRFPSVYTIRSEPYGAAVRYHDSIVGTTPYILSTLSAREFIHLAKEGYEDETIPLTQMPGEIIVHLKSILPTPAGGSPLMTSGEESKNLVPVYVAAGATVAAGFAAAFFKIQADGKYNDYRVSGDPARLDEIHRLDNASGIALLTSEIGLIALSYFLLSR